MGIAEIRGFLAFAVVLAAIVYLWVQFDDAPDAKAVVLEPTTTTVVATPTTSTTPEQAAGVVCDRAAQLEAVLATIDDHDNDGPIAELALEFWTAVLPDLPVDVRTEAVAVVGYYEGYLEVAAPFDHDPVRIIIEGDKERYEQLLTRPAPGLENSRGFILFVCGVETPDKPSMSSGGFRDLEERLLDPDPLEPLDHEG